LRRTAVGFFAALKMTRRGRAALPCQKSSARLSRAAILRKEISLAPATSRRREKFPSENSRRLRARERQEAFSPKLGCAPPHRFPSQKREIPRFTTGRGAPNFQPDFVHQKSWEVFPRKN
jgi:hypothetical protein